MTARSLYDARAPGFFGARVARLAPALSGGAVHAMGWSFTSVGALIAPSLTTTSMRTQMRRVQAQAGVSISVGLRSTAPVCWRATDGNPGAGRGGFCFSIRFAIGTGASSRAFVGVAAQTSPVTNIQPSTATNMFGVGFDSSATTWSVLSSDGLGNRTVSPIAGATVNDNVWDLTVLCAPSSTSMRMSFRNVTTGVTLVHDAEYGINLPDGDVLLHVHAHCYAVASTHSIEIMSASLEVPDGATFVEQPVGRDGVYNVRDFGATGGGSVDDLPAFRAALAAMGTDITGPGRQGTLLVPPGSYLLTDNLELNRIVLLKGVAPGVRYAGPRPSRLVFSALKGIRIYGLQNDPECRGDATYVAIEDLQIQGSTSSPLWGEWTASTNYTVGATVLPAESRAVKEGSSWEYYYECVRAGQTAATEPDWSGTTPLDVPVQAVTPPIGVWLPDTEYAPRHVIRSSTRWDVFFVCTTPGRSNLLAEPALFATASPTDVIPDGTLEWTVYSTTGYLVAENGSLASPGINTLVWACRVSSGIYAQTRFSTRRLSISGFLNAGITVQAAGQTDTNDIPTPGNANGFSVFDVTIANCGGGILTRAHDVNAGYVSNAQVHVWNDDRAFGIADKGQLGNRFVSCSVNQCGGPSFDQRSDSSTGSMFGCFATPLAGLPSNIRSTNGYGVFGNDFQSGFAAIPNATFVGAIDANDWREVYKDDGTTSAKLYASPYLMSAAAPGDTFLAVGYDFAGVGMGGWWTWFIGSSTGSSLAWSGSNAMEGGGTLWAYNGILVGGTKSIITSDAVRPDISALGTWRTGDMVMNQAAASGLPSYWQCVGAGSPGTWTDGPALP